MDDFQTTTQAPELPADGDDFESLGEEELRVSLLSRLMQFLRKFWLKRRMVLCILAAGILIAVLYALSLPNVYTSTTALMPPSDSSPYPGIIGELTPNSVVGEIGSEALGLETRGELFIAILNSRNVQDSLIARLGLANYFKTDNLEDARRSLTGATKIEEERKSGIITISVSASNPVLAANMARGYVEELDRVVTDDSTSAARRERIFLEERVKEVKRQLDDSAKQLSQFSSKSGAIDISSQTKSMVEEGLRLQAELIEGRSQLAALRQTYSEDNSRVRALEAHNTELQRELDKMGGAAGGSGTNASPNESPYPTADELPALGLTYYDLERKMRVEEALWEALTRQYESAKVEEAEEIPTVRILDVANVPSRKSGPSRRLIVEVGALLSLVLACTVVLAGMFWEAMDPESEPKRMFAAVIDGAFNAQRWYWKLPGMRWIQRHSRPSNELG
ncbi:MAG TPA: GNVR domain-containing protein [Terracidiphilus sp.]|jgi:uncharacterized protein involved in exopolysaccharide biosynthesis